MRTVKLVLTGPSGVGESALRGKGRRSVDPKPARDTMGVEINTDIDMDVNPAPTQAGVVVVGGGGLNNTTEKPHGGYSFAVRETSSVLERLAELRINFSFPQFQRLSSPLTVVLFDAMIFGSFLTALLLTTAAFAAPEGAIARRSRRSASRQSIPVQRLTSLTAATHASNVAYTDTWAGAIWDSYPPNTFYKVVGTFTVPAPSAPDGEAAVWVGIDGYTCQSAILQTGIDMYYKNGAITYDSWYEWWPDHPYIYSSPIAIRAGDIIRLTVTTSSPTSGTTLIENLTTGQSESQSLSNPSHPLCLQNAEWIVEDSSLAPFCNFGTVTFSSASAYLHGGKIISPSGAVQVNMYQKGKILTSVSGSDTVTVKYVP
ncbi:Peptidase A4 family domain containing protein [Amanita muscaria]